MNNGFFEKWYKNKVEDGNETPPAGAWENISNKLDINEVWENVGGELNYMEAKVRRRKGLVFALLFLPFLFIATVFYMKTKPGINNNTYFKAIKQDLKPNLPPKAGPRPMPALSITEVPALSIAEVPLLFNSLHSLRIIRRTN